MYAIELFRGTVSVSWLSYLWYQFYFAFTPSHACFILVLILFQSIYLLYWKFIRPHFSLSKFVSNSVPSNLTIGLVILVVGLLTFLLRFESPIGYKVIGISPSGLLLNFFMFSLGILMRRKNYLESLTDKIMSFWFFVSIPLMGLFTYTMFLVLSKPELSPPFLGGPYWQSLVLSIGEIYICVGLSALTLYLCRKFANFTNEFLTWMTENRYGVYIFHSLIVVVVTIALQAIEAPALVKFFIASVLSVLLSFSFVSVLRQVPLIRRII